METEAPSGAAAAEAAGPVRAQFDAATLPAEFQWLRSPWPEELFSLTDRPGFLRLHGRESVGSAFKQALVGRRQQAHCYSASTLVEFEPRHFQQMAGLICYYNAAKFHYLYISHDDVAGKHLRVMSALPDQPQTDAFTPAYPPASGPVELRVEVDTTGCGSPTGQAAPTGHDSAAVRHQHPSDEATTRDSPNSPGVRRHGLPGHVAGPG
jgi:xylan 1,4-beta-xylosidase